MTPSAREPAAYAEAVRVILMALVALGWITLDDNTANAIASGIAAVLSVVLTFAVRKHVTPVETIQAQPPNA